MKRVLLCTALILWSAMASAVVYKWVDAQGKTQYGDRPPDGVHADVVELLGTHVPHAAAPRRLPRRPRLQGKPAANPIGPRRTPRMRGARRRRIAREAMR